MEPADLYEWLVGYLDGSDPIDLVSGGAPAREYELEARLIVEALPKIVNRTDLAAKIHRIFVDCFNASIAGGPGRYIPIADHVYSLWKREQKKNVLSHRRS